MWLRWTLIVLLVMLLGSNLAWAYKLLDFGVTYSYLDGEYESCIQRTKQLSDIALQLGASYEKTELMNLIAKVSPSDASFEEDGATWIGRLGFVFVDGRLSQIILDDDEYFRSIAQ